MADIEISAALDDRASSGLDELSRKLQAFEKVSPPAFTQFTNIDPLLANLGKRADETSNIFVRFGTTLEKAAKAGIEPIAHLSPTAGRALEGLLSKLSPVQLGFAGVAGGAVAAGATLLSFTRQVGESIERLDNLALRTGLAIESLEALQAGAKRVGVDFDSLSFSFARINSAIAEVSKGNFETDAQFKLLGISLTELVSSGASTEQILERIAQALSGIEDPQKRAAAAMDLFGNRGAALIPILEDIATKGLGGYVEAAKKAGIVTTDLQKEIARSFDKMHDDAAETFTGIKNSAVSFLSVVSTLLPKVFVFGPGAAEKAFEDVFENIRKNVAKKSLRIPVEVGATGAGAEIDKKIAEINRQSVVAAEAAQTEIRLIQAQASGNRLAEIELEFSKVKAAAQNEKAEKLKAASEAVGGTKIQAALREQAELQAMDKIALAEADLAAKRKAIIEEFTNTARAAVERFGQGFEEIAKKLDLQQALSRARGEFEAFKGLFDSGVISAREFTDLTSKLTTELSKAGASGKQIGDVLPQALKDAAAAAKAAEEALVKEALAVAKAAREADEFARASQRAEQASRKLEIPLVKESLDDAFNQVSEAAAGATDSIGEFIDAGDPSVVRTQTNALDEYLGRIRRIESGDAAGGGAPESRESRLRRLRSHRATLGSAIDALISAGTLASGLDYGEPDEAALGKEQAAELREAFQRRRSRVGAEAQGLPEAIGALNAVNAEIARLEGRNRELAGSTAGGPGFGSPGFGGVGGGSRSQTPEERKLLGPSAMGDLFESPTPGGFTVRARGGGGGGSFGGGSFSGGGGGGFGGEDIAAIINALGPMFSAARGRSNVFTGAPLDFEGMRSDMVKFAGEVAKAVGAVDRFGSAADRVSEEIGGGPAAGISGPAFGSGFNPRGFDSGSGTTVNTPPPPQGATVNQMVSSASRGQAGSPITVVLQGTNIIDSERRMYDMARTISRDVRDRTRRGV